MAHRNLGKVHFACDRCNTTFVLGKAVGMHEYDRDGFDPGSLGCLQIGAYRGEIRLPLHGAVSAHALVNFRHTFIEHLGLDDVTGKYFWARLVTDLERVTKALG